jgi:hypothetical protein
VFCLLQGLCISNSIAVFEALIGHKSAFERTPKFGTAAASKPSVWKATTYMSSVRKATGIFWEMAMALLVATVIVTGFIVTNPDPLVVPWLVFFFISFLYIAYLHIQVSVWGRPDLEGGVVSVGCLMLSCATGG